MNAVAVLTEPDLQTFMVFVRMFMHCFLYCVLNLKIDPVSNAGLFAARLKAPRDLRYLPLSGFQRIPIRNVLPASARAMGSAVPLFGSWLSKRLSMVP